jgi:hypothetical protein
VPGLAGVLAVCGKIAGVLPGAVALGAVPPPPHAVNAKALMNRAQMARSRRVGWNVVGMRQLLGLGSRAQAAAPMRM